MPIITPESVVSRNQVRLAWVCLLTIVGFLVTASFVAVDHGSQAEFNKRMVDFNGLLIDVILEDHPEKTKIARQLKEFLKDGTRPDGN